MQLLQLALTLISPAVLGALSYLSLLDCAEQSSSIFNWAIRPMPFDWAVSKNFRVSELTLLIYLVLYSLWTLQSYFAVQGRMPEMVCQFLAICSLCFVIPIFYGLCYTIITRGLDFATGLIIFTLVMPSFLAFSTSFTSGFLYCLYLPWSLSMVIFLLVYIPSYSFARLYDTTWGNGNISTDTVMRTDALKMMKSRNLVFIFFLILVNFLLTYGFIKLQTSTDNSARVLIILLLFPSIIQICFSSFFLLVAKPLRPFFYKAPIEITVTSK